MNEHLPTARRKLSLLKISSYAGLSVGVMALFRVLMLLFFPDPLVNRFIMPRVTKAFAKGYPEYSISIADMNYRVFKSRFKFDSVPLSAVDRSFSSHVGTFSVSGLYLMHLLWVKKLKPKDFANAAVDAQDIEMNFPRSQTFGLSV